MRARKVATRNPPEKNMICSTMLRGPIHSKGASIREFDGPFASASKPICENILGIAWRAGAFKMAQARSFWGPCWPQEAGLAAEMQRRSFGRFGDGPIVALGM
jgi:hypothetical protein